MSKENLKNKKLYLFEFLSFNLFSLSEAPLSFLFVNNLFFKCLFTRTKNKNMRTEVRAPNATLDRTTRGLRIAFVAVVVITVAVVAAGGFFDGI